MKLAINTGALSKRYGDFKTLEILKMSGFDAYDYTMSSFEGKSHEEWIEYLKELKKYADDLGIECVQAHSPEPQALDEKSVSDIARSIEYASVLGAKITVVHPLRATLDTGIMYYQNHEEIYEKNKKLFGELLPHVKKHEVKIAIENMFGMDLNRNIYIANTCSHTNDFIRYIDGFDSEYITACFDIGHAALVSENPADMIYKMGKRIRALHVQDVDFVHDLHTLPFMGKLDWDEICAALSKSGYDGNFTFEIGGSYFSAQMTDNVILHAAKFAQTVGRSLIQKIG